MSTLETELGHLKNHVDYPASTKQINAACNNMSDLPQADRSWFQTSLPEGNYKNPDEVVSALLKKV
ncbi:MAG: hypothetical protein ACRDF4_00600 [Rhabdochlamydiaceae bacterium]